MPQLLLEFFSEEIPARMQPRAEADLERLLSAALKESGLGWETFTTFAGARRLGCVIEGLPARTEAVREERKGPRTDAPEKALQGFMRGAGVDSLDQCEVREDKKGSFYVAVIEKPGVETADVIARLIPDLVKNFPWTKSMKFGEDARAQRWVRPLQRIVCLFDGAVVPVEVFGIEAGDLTEGHRLGGQNPIKVSDFASYRDSLRKDGKVVLDRAEREDIILEQAKRVCEENGARLREDSQLLTEVAGLVEDPHPLFGQMDPDFLDLPPEVIQLSMKTHQKYFAVEDARTGELLPNFVVVANQAAPDGGAAIAAGNARVLSARLSDARHFWDNDRKTKLDDMAAQLDKVTFHQKLGTVADKVERVAALARELAPAVGADPDMAERAARLSKADLVSEMVYEFPELQGVMGRYYALEQGEPAEIADAIRDHYKPQGPSDAVPAAPVSAAVALADKLDTLVGFWAIDEKPTGSKDPFALRRAALGVIRIVVDAGARIKLVPRLTTFIRNQVLAAESHEKPQIFNAFNAYEKTSNDGDLQRLAEAASKSGVAAGFIAPSTEELRQIRNLDPEGYSDVDHIWIGRVRDLVDLSGKILAFEDGEKDVDTVKAIDELGGPFARWASATAFDLLAFFADRLKVHLKDDGISHDVIDAVFALGDDDLVRVTNRARALQGFLDTEDGKALLAGYKRAANILKAEEKKDGEGAFEGDLDADYAPVEAEEKALIAALDQVRPAASKAVEAENFEGAMAALSQMRAPVDAFFDKVTVNDKDDMLRRNRLRLLAMIRKAAHTVADFSRIEG